MVWAIPLCSEGGTLAESGRKVWKDTVWATDALPAPTYQIWLLTAGVVHFCPTRLCRSAWLGENLSRCPSPPGTQELLPTRPLLSYKNLLSELQRGKHLCIESWSSGGKVGSSQPSFGLLYSLWGTEKTRVFPTLREHSFGATRPSSSPKNKPPCPSPLPPTHTHTLCCMHPQPVRK